MLNDSSKEKAAAHEGHKRPEWWSPLRGIAAVIISFVGSELAVAFALPFFAQLFLHTNDAVKVWINSVVGGFVYVALTEGLTLLVLWLLLRGHATLRTLGFGRRPKLNDAGWAILAGLAYFVVFLIVISIATALFHVNLDQKQELGFDNIVGNTSLVLTFVSLVILPPFVEEVLFRGVLFGGFRRKLPMLQATLLTSIFFAAPHLLESGNGGLLWIAGIDTFVLSLALCYVREKTQSLWSGIALHMLKNGVAFASLYLFTVR